ncbi:alpha beta-hydrolase [Coniophora puteana RWD-64-598 SS2]|uniref:Dipeptidyl-peptidase V n=1 Tax=Coniophora puteana (strain RWD-64-598) TaxID=741705 RepID=A0A5M3MPA9_CONPW|nr:alpha beta-hydrolase [Coniophora puteana RWD-64-598 SS2]EIW81008.1 alpha beta-hydrolase [Coniophora puteana RWD-64-598 SS2]
MPAQEFAFREGGSVLSPKDMLELPRSGAAVANPSGDLAIVPISKYSFADKKNVKSLAVIGLEAGQASLSIPLPDGGEAFWLDDRTLAHIVEAGADDAKRQDVRVIPLTSFGDKFTAGQAQVVGSFPVTTATNFRYVGKAGRVVFSAYVHADGDLKTVAKQDKAYEERGNTALVYDETFERHWDHWVGPTHLSLFSVSLAKDGETWVMGTEFINALKNTPHSSPVEPFGGTDDFDVSSTHIVYTTKDPELPQAVHTKQNVYIVPFDGSKVTELTSGKQGATHSPVFNKQGDKIAWTELDEDGYETDKAKIVIFDLTKNVRYTLTQSWDRSADSLAFSEQGDFLYLTAGDEARVKILTVPLPETPSTSTTHPDLSIHFTPRALTQSGAASGLQILPGNRALFSQSSYLGPNDAYIIRKLDSVEDMIRQQSSASPTVVQAEVERLTSHAAEGLQGKYLAPGEDFRFKGADDVEIQGWILKPEGFAKEDKKKWAPLLLIHGGPQSAWQDQWSTRWNPNVFTNQGYFVVAINPSGSTTFGQNLTDAITGDWGGKPFVDLRKGWQYILDNYPQIDPDRAVAAGASWGGYAINWIQSNPDFGFNFKALVCHDGVFDAQYNGYSTDELFFFNHDWSGRPWDPQTKKLIEKYSPANHIEKWSTPQLLIHGSKDYRLPETESIGVFHTLQQLGITTRLVIFPDENHWVLKQGNSLKWHYEVFRWFDQFVGSK